VSENREVAVLGRASIASAVVLLAASGCGGSGGSSASKSGPDCGKTYDHGPGEFGGDYGGKSYQDVEGVPVVSIAGKGTSCKQLLALADAYAHKKGPELFAWLDKHHWIWMNYDDEARPYAVFDLDKNDVFVGKPPARPGQRSQVAFGM
jgi:hypothetical protein